MNTLTTTMERLSRGARPLASLTNDQLFKYPEADPSEEAYSKFCMELVHRRGITANINEAVNEAKRAVERAKHSLLLNNDPDLKAEFESRLASRKRDVERAEKEAERKRAGGKGLTTDEITGWFKEKNLHRLEPLIERWNRGSLFSCQSYGFGSFLLVSEKERKFDELTFKEYQGIACLCGEEDGKLFNEITCFFHTRIMPGLVRRERFTDGEDGNKTFCAVMGLSEGLKKEYWTWLWEYNGMTVRFNWKDDSGVAYSGQQELGVPADVAPDKVPF